MSEEEKIKKLYTSGQMLLEVVEELENRINKAKEYIKNADNICIKDFIKEQLLEILGDKENE